MRRPLLRGFLFAIALSAAASAQDVPPAVLADYQAKLDIYERAHGAFEQEAAAYWDAIADKRRGRNAKRREPSAIALDDYVLTQPPVYTGPKRPSNPLPDAPPPPEPPAKRKYSGGRRSPCRPPPRITMWAAARQPASEAEFKRAYARYAARAPG